MKHSTRHTYPYLFSGFSRLKKAGSIEAESGTRYFYCVPSFSRLKKAGSIEALDRRRNAPSSESFSRLKKAGSIEAGWHFWSPAELNTAFPA